MPYGYGTNVGYGGMSGMPMMGGSFLNPYVMIIVILIVLQWFRVGSGGVGGVGGVGPEPGLLNNGGLFIIAIFLLAFCACGRRLY
jgi:hypothetical membrane protein